MSQTKPMWGGCFYMYNSCQTLIIESGRCETFPTPAFNLIWYTETFSFESGRCKTLPTPAFRKKAIIAGVGKVLQHLQSKVKVFFDIYPTGARPKGCTRPVFVTCELNTRQRCGEQKCSYDIRGCHTTPNLIIRW